MVEDKYLKLVINAPDRELFSYLQQNIVHEDIEMFYFPELSGIEEFISRIRPHLFLTVIHSQLMLNEKFQVFFKSPLFQDTNIIFILSDNISLSRLQGLGDLNKSIIFKEGTPLEIVLHNIKAILKKERTDLEQFSSREYSENLLKCAKIINSENRIDSLFEKLIHFLPKILPYDYISIFYFDPELNQIRNFNQFIPPHRRNSAVLTPNLEKLASVWIKKEKFFKVNSSEDPNLFKKLSEWGWNVKQIYFFPILNQKLPLGGMILGQVNLLRKGKTSTSFLREINELIGLKLYNLLLMGKSAESKDDFTEQLVHNRFSEESVLQLSCKKLNSVSKSENTIFWQINRGFGFLFPKYSYSTEEKASWKSLEKTVLFLSRNSKFNQTLSNDKVVIIDNVYESDQFDKSTLDTFRKLDYHHIIVAPICLQKEEVGVFVLNRTAGRPVFTSWEVSQISLLVDKIKKVLEDTYIVKEANLKLRQLSRIFELGNEIKLELNLEDILDRITKSIRKTLGWNDVAVLRFDDFQKQYRTISKLGFDKSEDLPINLSQTIGQKEVDSFLMDCQKLSHSYFYDSSPLDLGAGENGFFDNVITEWKNQDLLLIPIESRQKRHGFLVVRDPVERLKPTEDKIISLEYFANQAAVAVENSSLYESLQISEERYRALAETMTLGLVTATLDGNIVYINPAFEKLVGFNQKNLLDKPLIQYFSEDSQKKLAEMALQVMDDQELKKRNIDNIELELISSGGEMIPVSTYVFPFIRQKGNEGYFLVLNDLRVVKKLERLKADFNSMIVHDLRSPLNVIQGFIELIRTKVVGEINTEQEELLDIAKENVKKVLNLVDNFLVASKMEVGKFGIEPKISELNSIVERIVENHRVLLKNKKIQLETKLNSNLPLLYFDGLRIEQVMNNLLSNAVKHTKEGTGITVMTDIFSKEIKGEKKLFARIGVQDMGPGIDSDKLNTVFEKYEQVDSEMTPKSSGTGLGLAICKEIVNLHGGEIWVESEKKKGSTFYFTLPIEPSIEKVLK
ncbi:MAG: PAS domain S-box protein [Calditrichaeota bacterium]|nr:PAS domain S-box protein [Calditrichota bacterium]RQV92287.1 MAG: PAS domain S-box protein [bacterium]